MTDQEKAQVAITKGKNIPEIVRKAIDLIGGISKFVKKGNTVLLKPNLLMATPSRGAVTNPEVLKAIIKEVKTADPARIIVGESSLIGFDTDRAYEVTGAKTVVENENVEWIDFKQDKYTKIPIPDGKAIDHIYLPKTFLDCDVFVNIPVMKTHVQTKVTLAIKNQKGLLTDDDKSRVHDIDLEPCIADFAKITIPMHQNLIVIDGTWALEGFGPEAPPGEPFEFNVIVAGNNTVATDAVASNIMEISLPELQSNVSKLSLSLDILDNKEIQSSSYTFTLNKIELSFKS